ncbi:SusD family protein [bacterium A37T11]|nr:SusD family protein [bacterium A37T11]
MSLNKLALILIAASSVLWSGCSKFLETTPDMRTDVDTPEKIAELLTSAYPRGSYIPFMESMSDNAGDKGDAAGAGEYVNMDPWKFDEVRDRNQDSPDYYWYACYEAIRAANQALASIEAANDSYDYSAQRGEALVARAYAHFMLVSLYAHSYDPSTAATDPGIPYVTEPEEEVLKKYERKTVAYVYDMIEQDLETGLLLIDDNAYKVPKFHFTQSAAHAFASRFYLFKRSYQKVVDHASQVFPTGGFAGKLRAVNDPQYRDMEYYNKQAWFSQSENPANILLVEAVSVWGRNYSAYRYGLSTAQVNLYFGNNVTGGSYAYMIYGGTELVYNIPKFREHFVKEGLNATYGTPYNTIPLFSAEEVLMNRAEAYAMLGNYDQAVADLNTFASTKVFASQDNPVYDPAAYAITTAKLQFFYGSGSLQDNIISAVLDFKRREFMHEGLRYFDILRHNLPVTHVSNDRSETYFLGPNDLRRTLQLPQEVVLSGIEANPR